MLIKEGGCFQLYPWRVKYIQRGEEYEQWALPNKEWWVDFAKGGHAEIIEFVEVNLTEKQLVRYEEIKHLDISEGFREMCIDYIIDDKFPEGIKHPLRELQLQKNNEQLEEALMEISILLAQQERNNAQNEQAILELSMLMGGAG